MCAQDPAAPGPLTQHVKRPAQSSTAQEEIVRMVLMSWCLRFASSHAWVEMMHWALFSAQVWSAPQGGKVHLSLSCALALLTQFSRCTVQQPPRAGAKYAILRIAACHLPSLTSETSLRDETRLCLTSVYGQRQYAVCMLPRIRTRKRADG